VASRRDGTNRVSLRTRILLLFGAALAALLVVAGVVARWVVLDSFEHHDHIEALRDADRVMAAMDSDKRALAGATRDWAGWDDIYRFMLDRNAQFRRENLEGDASYINARINFMLLVANDGTIVFERGFDLRRGVAIPVPPALRQELKPGSALLQRPDTETAQSGLLVLPEGVVCLSAQPIVTNLRQGPVHGTLIWGRSIDAASAADLGDRLKMTLAIAPLPGGATKTDVDAGGVSLEEPLASLVLNGDVIAGYTLFPDLYGKPALVLRLSGDRDAYKQGVTAAWLVVILLGCSGLLLGGVVAVTVDRAVLQPVEALSRRVEHVAETGDVATRMEHRRNDEVGSLVTAINSMLEALHTAPLQRESQQRQLEQLARTDPLTGLLNRRSFESLAQRAVEQAALDGQPVSLLMLDLDHFKQVNDEFGHQQGDNVLRSVATLLQSAVRSHDMLARLGGDEFAVMMPGAGRAVAERVAERVLVVLRTEPAAPTVGPVTASIGVAVFPEHGHTMEALTVGADQALYRAKAGGRDRVAVYTG